MKTVISYFFLNIITKIVDFFLQFWIYDKNVWIEILEIFCTFVPYLSTETFIRDVFIIKVLPCISRAGLITLIEEEGCDCPFNSLSTPLHIVLIVKRFKGHILLTETVSWENNTNSACFLRIYV